MTPARRRRPASIRTTADSLESRLLLTTNGIGWADVPRLTLSFVPDGTDVAGHESQLMQTLDRIGSREEWTDAVDRAFAKWTQFIGTDVSVVDDGGQPLGASGPVFGDPRFGDVRLAAIPLNDSVYALSIAHDEYVSGTWAGDILINTNDPPQSVDDLFGIMLHEAGHVLGLGHSNDPASPMFTHGIPSSLEPTAEDIEELESLYGQQQQPGKGTQQEPESRRTQKRNDSFSQAVTLNPSHGFKYGRFAVDGAIGTRGDVDYYRFKGFRSSAAQTNATTIALYSLERGALIPEVTLLMANGNPVPNVRILQNGNGALVVEAPKLNPKRDYYLRVAAAVETDTTTSVGAYRLVISSRPEAAQSEVLLRGVVSAAASESVHRLFLARSQLLSLSLDVQPTDAGGPIAVGIGLFDARGRLLTQSSAGSGQTRSLQTLMLRAGTYYVTVRARSDGLLPEIAFSLRGIRSTEPTGPLPSDPTGDPAFPCDSGPDFCYTDGTVSPDPTHTTTGVGDDAPDFQPFDVLWPWSTWWPEDDGGVWLDPRDDVFAGAAGEEFELDLLANDLSVPQAEIQAVEQPEAGGQVTWNTGGARFQATAGFEGSATFRYAIGATQIRFPASDVAAESRTGAAVAVDGALAVVGAPFADDGAEDAGRVSVFERTNGEWLLVQHLTADDGSANDQFGSAVAVAGTTVVVAAPRNDQNGLNAGGVYVFDYDPGLGQLVRTTRLVSPVGHARDLFGDAIAFDGQTLVVGARAAGLDGQMSGAAWVYQRDDFGGWSVPQELPASNPLPGAQFGAAVAIDSGRIVVGAPRYDDRGAAYVFTQEDDGQFRQTGFLQPESVGTDDDFGTAVAISASHIVVGAPGSDVAFTNAGGAWIFADDLADGWARKATIHGRAQGDQTGTAVAMSGSTIAVSSPTADDGESLNSGGVQVFQLDDDGELSLPRTLTDDNAAAGGQFGHTIAVAGSKLIIGAPNMDSGGAATGQAFAEDLRIAYANVVVEVGSAIYAWQPAAALAHDRSPELALADATRAIRAASAVWGVRNTPEIAIVELPGTLLGLYAGDRILLDPTAAGYGWYVDRTPQTHNDDAIGSRMDLFSVLAHEVGHAHGEKDTYHALDAAELMYGFLKPGERRSMPQPR